MKSLLLVFFTCFTIFSSANAKYTKAQEDRMIRHISQCKWNNDIEEYHNRKTTRGYVILSSAYFSNCDINKTPDIAYKFGRIVYPFYKSILIKSATEGNDAESQFKLGEIYLFGTKKGISKDYKKAFHWYKKSAKQGNSDAQFKLGVMYDFDTSGAYEDYNKSIKWYKLSAEQGNEKAQYNLGVLYENGKNIKRNYKESIKWYKLAADQGLKNAKRNLGNMYLGFGNIFNEEDGNSEDRKHAAKWYKLAVEQGDLTAHLALGVLYAEGIGVEKDELKARKLFREVYENGSALKAEKAESLLNKYKL